MTSCGPEAATRSDLSDIASRVFPSESRRRRLANAPQECSCFGVWTRRLKPHRDKAGAGGPHAQQKVPIPVWGVPKNGQVQLPTQVTSQVRAHASARAAFASETIGSINYPFAMPFCIELAEAIKSTR